MGSERELCVLRKQRVRELPEISELQSSAEKEVSQGSVSFREYGLWERAEWVHLSAGEENGFHQVNWTKTKGGYPVESTVYHAEDCQGCPVKAQCTKGDGNRSLSVQWKLWHYREQARHNLLSAEGKRLRSQRGVDVEPVYARFKWCWGFRRFHLRGREKWELKWDCWVWPIIWVRFTKRKYKNRIN